MKEIIPANDDFNNYTNVGIYNIPSYQIGLTISNSPSLAGGKLIVENLGNIQYIMQTWIPHDNVTIIYKRIHNDSGWGNWIKTLTGAELRFIKMSRVDFDYATYGDDHSYLIMRFISTDGDKFSIDFDLVSKEIRFFNNSTKLHTFK